MLDRSCGRRWQHRRRVADRAGAAPPARAGRAGRAASRSRRRALAAADPETGAVARELALRVRAGHRRAPPPGGRALGAGRHRPRPGVAARPGRRARRDRAPGPQPARRRRRLPDAGRPRAAATPTCAPRPGSVSARFQALRLPPGAGLGGLVAQTRRPYWTADYPADERYRHTREIDAAVDEEGLVAICGTPLLVERRVRRACCSPRNRTPPRVPPRRGGAARLAGRAGRGVAGADPPRPPRRPPRWPRCRRRTPGSSRPRRRTTGSSGVVLGGGGVRRHRGRARRAAGLLGGRARRRRAAARRARRGAGRPGRTRTDPLADAPAVRRSAETGRLAEADGMWAVAVTAAGQRLGTLVLGGRDAARRRAGPHRRARGDGHRAGAAVPAARGRGRPAGAHRPARRPARPARAGATTVDRGLVERGRLLGLRLQTPHVLAVCRCAGRAARGLLLAAGSAGDGGRGLAGEHGDGVVVLVPGRDPSAVADGPGPARLRPGGTGRSRWARAGRSRRPRGLATAHAEARRTADALVALGLAGRGGSAARPRLRRAGGRRRRGRRRLPGARARSAARPTTQRRGSDLRRHAGGLLRRGVEPAPAPRPRCTCTSTPSASGWTGWPRCSARTGRPRTARWRSSSPCACAGCARAGRASPVRRSGLHSARGRGRRANTRRCRTGRNRP